MPNAICTLIVNETDGELSVTANIPTSAEGTLAETLTHQLLNQATKTINEVFRVDKKPNRVVES